MNLTFSPKNESFDTSIKLGPNLLSDAPKGKYWSHLYASNLNGDIKGYESQ